MFPDPQSGVLPIELGLPSLFYLYDGSFLAMQAVACILVNLADLLDAH